MKKIDIFRKHLREERAVKIISGIDNFNLASVKKVAIAAQSGLASALDVAASEEVIKCARENTKLPIFVSSINPFALLDAAKWGADAIEIGNYEALYKRQRSLSAQEVYDITLETMSLTAKYEIFTCVTVPGCLTVDQQIELAQKLELLGIDLIQTEGVARSIKNAHGSMGLIDAAKSTIANTMELSNNVSVPIMSASGLTSKTVPLAFAAGAKAVGVGSCVNKLDTQIAMIATVRALVGSISNRNALMQEIRYGVGV